MLAASSEPPTATEPLTTAELLALVQPLLDRENGLSPDQCLDGIEAVHRLQAQLAAARIHGTTQLATRTGERLLRRQRVTDPQELSRTRRDRWRARTKSATSTQLAALTGWGRGKSRQLVAIALAPDAVRRPISEGLEAGIATWDQVEQFWRQAGRLREDHGPRIARALFATTATPDEVDPARLDPDGAIRPTPWQAKDYARSLARLLTAARGEDPRAEATDRRARYDQRDARACVDDDGSGQLVITGDAASIAACADRLQVLARRARAAGDPRTEAKLRSDLARSLLLYGTLPLTDSRQQPPAEDVVLDPEGVARLAQVLTGTPTYHLQVLVPWDVLTGRPVLGSGCHCGRLSSRPGAGQPPAQPAGQPPAPPTGQPPAPPTGQPPAQPAGQPPAQPVRGGAPPAAEGLGAVLGRESLFLPAGALRAAALAPGTTLSRVLFDPADGRCIERSVARYRPDRAMREQVLAADVHSRGIGSVTPARDCQLDHVLAYAAGGLTTETNLQALDTGWHWGKTAGEWVAAMEADRTVTWTSMFGRLYRTRAHDYRQYFSSWLVLSSEEDQPDAGSDALRTDDRRDLASFLVYAALSARRSTDRVAADDDDPDSDDELIGGPHAAIWLRHTRESDGRKVDGTRPGTPTPEQIVEVPPATILRSRHWTDPFARTEEDASETVETRGSDRDEPPPF